MVPLTETVPKVCVATITTIIYNDYDALEETINHFRSLKIKSYLGEKDAYCCAEILGIYERLDTDGDFNTKHLGYITQIFEDAPDNICNILSGASSNI